MTWIGYECDTCLSMVWHSRTPDEGCECGGKIRRLEVMPSRVLAPRKRGSGITMVDCTVVDCGTAVKMDGGHADIDGLAIVDTPIGLDLNGGATVNVRDLTHKFTKHGG